LDYLVGDTSSRLEEAVFDCDIAAFGIANITEATAE
jgi:hypothetical protein